MYRDIRGRKRKWKLDYLGLRVLGQADLASRLILRIAWVTM